MAVTPTLEEKLKSLPQSPGCYLYKDAAGEIIYVGKAINLRNRVRSYFQKGTKHSAKTRKLVSRITDVDIVVVDSELEALVLECNLIKQHRPHYNVRLRDDKHYPYLMLTLSEPFPRLLVTRRIKQDGNKYFGPFTNSRAVWDSLRLIYRLFPLVTCRKSWNNTPQQRPCLYHHMGRCPHAPCAGLGNQPEYRQMVDDVALFLDGKQDKLVKQLRTEMEAASEDLQFERAARLRDQLQGIETLIERQKVVSTNQADQDIIALVNDQGKSAVQMFYIRNGKLIGQEHFLLDGMEGEEGIEQATADFVKQYYQDATYVPKEIILPTHVEETVIIEQWLKQKRGAKVTLTVPERGEKKQLLDMAAQIVGRDRIGIRFFDRVRGDVPRTVRLGHRQRDEGRLMCWIRARAFERHVQRLTLAPHHRLERRIDRGLDRGHRAEAGRQVEQPCAIADQALLDALVERDVGAPEPIDRLLRIADHEQLARLDADRRRVRGGGVVRA